MRTTPTIRRRHVLGATAMAVLLLAACGGEEDTNSATPQVVGEAAAATGDDGTDTAASTASDEELALEFADCMRAEGTDWPDPITNADGSIDLLGGLPPGQVVGNGGGGPDDEIVDALDVCGPIVEGASFLPDGPAIDTDTQDLLVDFAQCLRDNGLDVDDPDLSVIGGGGQGAGLFGDDFDPSDPAAQEPISICQGIFAGSLGGG